jgi:hypothetical protein
MRVAAVLPGSDVVAVVSGNRYTSTDTPGGLPTEDQIAFEAGDELRLINRDGSSASSDVERILGIVADEVTLSGDFGGALAAGLVLTTADAGQATARQLARYVFAADAATQTIAGTGEQVWRWGEP